MCCLRQNSSPTCSRDSAPRLRVCFCLMKRWHWLCPSRQTDRVRGRAGGHHGQMACSRGPLPGYGAVSSHTRTRRFEVCHTDRFPLQIEIGNHRLLAPSAHRQCHGPCNIVSAAGNGDERGAAHNSRRRVVRVGGRTWKARKSSIGGGRPGREPGCRSVKPAACDYLSRDAGKNLPRWLADRGPP
jgi:hypothetical protein